MRGESFKVPYPPGKAKCSSSASVLFWQRLPEGDAVLTRKHVFHWCLEREKLAEFWGR